MLVSTLLRTARAAKQRKSCMDGVIPIIALLFIYLLMMNCARNHSDAPRQWARFLEPMEQR